MNIIVVEDGNDMIIIQYYWPMANDVMAIAIIRNIYSLIDYDQAWYSIQ